MFYLGGSIRVVLQSDKYGIILTDKEKIMK